MESELKQIVRTVKKMIQADKSSLDVESFSFTGNGLQSLFHFQFDRDFISVSVNGWPAYFKKIDKNLQLMVTPKNGDLIQVETIKI